jgi:hypothetical protein
MRLKIVSVIDAWDRRAVRALHAKMDSRVLRSIVIALTFLGYGWNWFLLAPLSLVHAWYPAVSRLGGALIAAWCGLMLLKKAFPRTRPFRAMLAHHARRARSRSRARRTGRPSADEAARLVGLAEERFISERTCRGRVHGGGIFRVLAGALRERA